MNTDETTDPLTGTIKSSWLKMEPRIDARFWLRVLAVMDSREIEPSDATVAQVKECIDAVYDEARSMLGVAGENRANADLRVRAAEKIEEKFKGILTRAEEEKIYKDYKEKK